ncbi:MAG: DUF1559 domain-containing protein [Pirellulales bacterium]|nr:DUF1559 domain-containing protein [Pirellulales bacterium]
MSGRKKAVWSAAIVLMLLIVAFVVYASSKSKSRETDECVRRIKCFNSLRQIGMALHSYHNVYHVFPPAYTVDENGRPMHSWRMLILPYLEDMKGSETLYKQFRLDEPWDSPHNLAVARREIPKVFRCKSDRPKGEFDTSYVMPIGPGMFSDGPTARATEEFKDGKQNTIAVVEMSGTGILWTEPRDWKVPEGPILVNPPQGLGMCANHLGLKNDLYMNVLFADCTVIPLPAEIAPELLRATLTIDGGEPIDDVHNLSKAPAPRDTNALP